MYYYGYNKLFIGMIFLIFNFNIGPINIIPDFIGFIMIYQGLCNLELQNQIFEKGKIWAAVLAVLNIGSIVKMDFNSVSIPLIGSIEIPLMIFGTIKSIMRIYLIFIICNGIYRVADENGHYKLKKDVKSRWKFYLIMALLSLFSTPFYLNLSQEHMMIPLILSFISILLVLGLTKDARDLLSD